MKRWQLMMMAMTLGTATVQFAAGSETGLPDGGSSVPAATVIAEAEEKNALSGTNARLRDPFAMRGNGAEGDEYIHAGLASIPSGLRVVAILSMEGKVPVGALFIPGSKNLHFVQEGEVIQLDANGANLGMPAASQLYLLVKSITENTIEIAPQARPQDVRIYR